MLLVDLVKLFSTNCNTDEEQFLNIIESNNIKLNQRLLIQIKEEKKNINNTSSNNGSSNNMSSNNRSSNNESSNIETSNIETSNIETSNNENSNKKTTGTRGRGRPRKTKDLVEESDVILEVELITLDGKEYYKTRENVLICEDLSIEGILSGDKVLRVRSPM